MSKHSLRYNLNQRKYSLKFIIYLFILFDILLFFQAPLHIFWLVIGWESAVFFGILIGLRGQARYREIVEDFIAIRKDPYFNKKEELRGFKMVRHMDHVMIEYDLWMSEQEAKTRNINKKKTKNKIIIKGGKIMKTEAIKELLAWVGAWIIAGGIVLDEALYLSGISLPWIIAITFLWISGDFLYFWYLRYYWELEREDIPVALIPKPIPIPSPGSNILNAVPE